MKKFTDSYLQYLHAETTERDVDTQWCEIVTPFTDHRNDSISLYVRPHNDRYILSDRGDTFAASEHLFATGPQLVDNLLRLDPLNGQINEICAAHGVMRTTGYEFSLTCTEQNTGAAMHRLLQTLLQVDALLAARRSFYLC